MKKLFLLLICALIFAFPSIAQEGIFTAFATDTLDDAETIQIELSPTFRSAWNTIAIQVVFTNISGTTAGTATLETSLDGISWETLTEKDGLVSAWPNISFTIVDGGVVIYLIQESPFMKYRVNLVGSGTQATDVSGGYVYKYNKRPKNR